MSYMHINNLYKDQKILLFKHCYALEKVHGTSAHVSIDITKNTVKYSSGGSSHDRFRSIFNEEELLKLANQFSYPPITIYGEAYGGKIQKMSYMYGKEIKFIVFDVMIDGKFLSVESAFDITNKLNLEFVDFKKITTELSEIDRERDKPSSIGLKLGLGEHIREGIVLRPVIEMSDNSGSRIIAKHKTDKFSETSTKREIDPEKQIILENAKDIALEWVTEMRLEHVIDAFIASKNIIKEEISMEHTGTIIIGMINDILREGEGEFIDSKEVRKAISVRTAQIFKDMFQKKLREEN